MKLRGRPKSADGRGQSETLGFVLVFSLLIIGALVVVGLGATAIGDTEKQLADDRAEQTLTQFDSKAGLVALEESDSQSVSLPDDGGEQFYVREDAGWMAVVIENRSTGNTQEIVNTTLGAVTYENGRTSFAYQGGGVWRATESGGQMLSPPEFHYRNGTLTLPAVTVTGDKALDGSAVITQNGTTKEFPTGSSLANETNPLEQFEIKVVVGSDYYKGWGQYFEERTDGAVKYNDSAETATLELVAPADFAPVEAGLFSGTTDELLIRNNANVSSYNSTTGKKGKGNGRVVVAGDLRLKKSNIYGDIEVGGNIYKGNPSGIIHDGNISYGGTTSEITGCGDSAWDVDCGSYSLKNDADVGEPPVVNRLIDEQLLRLKKPENNDNDDVNDINGSKLECSGGCEISAGDYYLDKIELTNNLEFNTTGGNINLAVNGNVTLDNNVEMNIEGPNRVNLYLNETFTGENGFKVGNRSNNKPADQFWMYLRTDGAATFENVGTYVGVVYGPGGQFSEGAEISIAGTSNSCGNCDIYGGLLGDIKIQVNNVPIHFDEALIGAEPVTVESTMVKITYLHITVNEIRVED